MKVLLVTMLLISVSMETNALELDDKIKLIIKTYQLKPKQCRPKNITIGLKKRIYAGKELFESVSLSGDRDISCKTCHLEEFNLTDGLPLAVGVGGKGEGKERYGNKIGALVQRNAISLRARGDKEFSAFFWDGKVHEMDGVIYSQFGDAVKDKFKRPLELAAILPLVERDEFIGKVNFISANDVQEKVKNKLYMDRYYAVSEAIRERVLNPTTTEDKKLKSALLAAEVSLDSLELSNIGALLATFIEHEFQCTKSRWDLYLDGNKEALTSRQKKGVILFFGKARCVSCHSGKLMSDFRFHSIGQPQGGFGPHSRHRDIGRAGVTHNYSDLYKFRTPPLIEVAKNAPYGHNGAFESLEEVVRHHVNPVAFYRDNETYYKADQHEIGKLLGSRDEILSTIDINKQNEILDLVEFLNAL